ncbi:helix-turn-helix transcriptional regulator [Kitasatospora sp. NPDC006697]|uniref:helix-turn-helix transcriptional regulator n=1 Tax=Kitasatospora sp. NPDC006697 TaxID=3364020 RepID=UPI0036AC56DE
MRHRLAQCRRALGHSQESFAVALQVDRSTVVRWERGNTTPQPHLWPRLAQVLQVTLAELNVLLLPQSPDQDAPPTPGNRADTEELDEMNRRDFIRALSTAGTLLALPGFQVEPGDDTPPATTTTGLAEHEMLSAHLWQVFSLSRSKASVYPMVRYQLGVLTTALQQPHGPTAHQRLCLLAGDLFQLAGEVFFDSNRYTDAVYCYSLATTASREAGAHDLWACTLTRQAYIGIHERQFADVLPLLEAASKVAKLGDSQLATRHWVTAVQAEAFAAVGDFGACERSLDVMQTVHALSAPMQNGGWLRFDGSRIAEGRGSCYLDLGRTELAEQALTEALAQPLSPRRQGTVLTGLATVGVQRGDHDLVLHYATGAVELAGGGDSGYVRRKLQGLQRQLDPLVSDRRIAELNRRISDLATTSQL